MSDDDFEAPRGPSAARPKRKKKRRPPVAAAPFQQLPPKVESTFTGGHLAATLVAGLVLGGMGGWFFRGSDSPEPGVAKDAPAVTAQNTARPATTRPQPPPEPAGPVYIALADYSPREGPQHAKVTILEFSDFQ